MGNLRGVPQPPKSSSYSSRPLRPLAPKAQCVHPSRVIPTVKRRMSQTTDFSKPEVVPLQHIAAVSPHPADPTTASALAVPLATTALVVPTTALVGPTTATSPAVPKPPVTPTTLEYPTKELPEFNYTPCWINNSHNIDVLSTTSLGDMYRNLKKNPDFDNELGGGYLDRSIQESAAHDSTSSSLWPKSITDRTVESPDTHPAPGSAQWQQATAPHGPYARQVPHQPQPSCAQCPSLWYFHLEGMMFFIPGQMDFDDGGMSTLMRSYKYLHQHVHEAHLLASGAVCTLCEDLFCYHLAKLMLLEGGIAEVQGLRLDLGSSLMTLRAHIREAHGGH
ncbi:hypothetical protein EV426DRAFT_707292 [Tirmania nivea]|nr:hypothetical protein EV426DRAFT_707292 [Tirmania nivea]